MKKPDPAPRLELLVSALLYLMTHHARTGCPRVAACVANHLDRLAAHPEAGAVLREISVTTGQAWRGEPGPAHRALH